MTAHSSGAGRGSGFRLSIVVPMHNEEDVIDAFFADIEPVLQSITPDYEIVCVNDGSTDGTEAKLRECCREMPNVRLVSLTRNFGKEIALTAGIDYADGDAVVPIDADLQDPPEVIPLMVEKWLEGFDMVLAVRSDRSTDTLFKRLTSNGFYRLAGWLSETPIPANAGDFRLMDRCVVNALKQLPERTRFMKGLFAWLGFRQATVYYKRAARAAGETKWKSWKLWNFALEGIFSFSTLPLRVWTYVGMVTALCALGYMGFVIGKTLIFGVDVPGYASILVVVLFFSGLNMIGLGIMGEYVGRTFIETKRRPVYLVRDLIGFGGSSGDASAIGKRD